MAVKRRNGIFLLMVIMLAIAGCNLQFRPSVITPTRPLATTPTMLPSLAPTPESITQPTLLPPPLTTFSPPTAIPLNNSLSSNGTIIPTVSTQQATGHYQLTVRPGQTIGINYIVTVNRGSIILTMQGTEGGIWQKTFIASETGRAEVTVQQGGTYDIMVQIQNFDGLYNVNWD
jgi:hypothetical protein